MKSHPNALMSAALNVSVHVYNRADEGDPAEWIGDTWFYFDTTGRHIAYEQRAPLRTEQGAKDKQRRETIQYLKDLRDQIDDVLTLLETRDYDEDGNLRAESRAWQPREWKNMR